MTRRRLMAVWGAVLAVLGLGTTTRWDGTNLRIVSGNLDIDTTGIRIAPSGSFDDSRAYGFTVTDGFIRLGGLRDSTHQGIGLNNRYDGATAGMEVQTGLDAEFDVSGQTYALTFVTANANASEAAVELLTFRGVGTNNGVIRLGGIPDFLGATSGSAGAIAGYINVKINGADRRIPYLATS